MPLGTLDRTPPPFFRQGPSALSKLTVCSALAIFLMVADVRLGVTGPLRVAVANVLYPFQWLVMQPVDWVRGGAAYLQSLESAERALRDNEARLIAQSHKANQAEQLTLENTRLRELLGMRERITTPSLAAQVLYDAADPFSRKVVIDRGQADAVLPGSPVIDAGGVLGQVTRVYRAVSEVTLITDADQAIPVLNTRTGARGVAFGDPLARPGSLELRFTAADTDIEPGDLLATSGVDGVYPPGLAVARVDKVERRGEAAFARIRLRPAAMVGGSMQVLVLQPVAAQIAPRPVDDNPPGAAAPAAKR